MWRFDIGGGRNVSQKWICWTGQAMLFRCCGTVIFGWFLVLWGYQSAFQWCLGVRLPRFEAKTTILQATQTSLNCVFIAVSDATFRRQACAKGDSTRDPCGRPGHAVSLLRICHFWLVLNVTFWHRGWEKCVSKMDLLNRPSHAVSLLQNRHFWLVLGVVGVSIGFSMVSGREAATIWGQNHDFAGHPNLIELCFYSSFRRNVLPNLCRCRCRLSFANLSFFWDSFWGSAALGGSP